MNPVDSDASIYTEYFRITREAQAKYGQKTVLFMQVGAFFEMYGVREPDGTITRSPMEDVCNSCGGLAMSEKKAAYGKGQILMAGFRDYTLDKHVQKMMDANYTVVVYVQVKTGNKITRELANVFSPGTFLSVDSDNRNTNNIMCIWIERFGSKMVCGLAAVNIFTGKSEISEYDTDYEMTPCAFDELERAISVYCPSEVVCISSLEESKTRLALQYSGLQCRSLHLVPSEDTVAARCSEQKYISHVLSVFYKEDTYDVCAEFHRYAIATQAFCYLLNFIQEHSPNIVRCIALPTFYNPSTSVVLANHTLRQLNIIDDHVAEEGGLRSVAAFLNKCCSAIGKRQFYQQIVHPTFDEKWIQQEYEMTERMLDAWDLVEPFRKLLREICDLEKMARQIVSKKLSPDSIYRLHSSLLKIEQIHVCLFEQKEIVAYLVKDSTENMDSILAKTVHFINQHLDVDSCAGLTSQTLFEKNVIRSGISPSLDELVNRKRENDALFEEVRVAFNRIMALQEGTPGKTDYVRVHETEKSGTSLQLTKKRSAALKKYFAGLGAGKTIQVGKIAVLASDIKMVAAGTSNDEIEFPILTRICREILSIKDSMNEIIAKSYADFLVAFEESCLSHLTMVANYVSRLDILQCKAYISRIYGYIKPRIDTDATKSYVDAKGLRHCLIERIQTNELYVANDIALSKPGSPNGILLYGTNAVGKTSLIRALGIAMIMAQSGLYVPATEFVYKPYTAIYSRILGNDNLFKNLSTFAVEMSELRVILNHTDSNSLVLGDELCSGTETESALSIFMAGLMWLDQRESSFIFATHFHEICRFDEMKKLVGIALKHMAVHYDREMDALVYDRVLKDGSGTRVYGLEVAKSLHLPEPFLERAYKIRNTYFPDTRGPLCASPSNRYNTHKLVDMCETCGKEPAREVHHLQEQRLADDAGFIGGVHKNHPANLMALCEKCHLEQHSREKPKVIKKKTTKGIRV